MKDVTIISQSRQKVGNVDVTFTVGKVNPTPATPTTGAKPGMAMPLGASQSNDIDTLFDKASRRFPNIMAALHRSEQDDDREEKCRQLARLGAAMGRVCR